MIKRPEGFQSRQLGSLHEVSDAAADVLLPHEAIFDNVSRAWNLRRSLNSQNAIELFKVDHTDLVLIHDVEELLQKWSSNLNDRLDAKNEVSKTHHTCSLRVTHFEESNIGELLLHHRVSDLLADLNNFGIGNVCGQVFGEESVLGIELRF